MRALAAALVLLVLAPVAMSTSGTPATFSTTYVSPVDGGGEPSIAIAGPDGAEYVTYPAFVRDPVFRSDDGGATWLDQPAPDPGMGGGDDALAIDRAGDVYLAGLASYLDGATCTTVSVSHDRGLTWLTQPAACAQGDLVTALLSARDDRPWIATYQPDITKPPVVLIYIGYFALGGIRSFDGGVTWQPWGSAGYVGGMPGNIVIDPATGRTLVFYAHSDDGRPLWSESDDLGTTWRSGGVPGALGNDSGFSKVTGAIDAGGNVHVAWSAFDGASSTIWHASSADAGRTWTTPDRVSWPLGGNTMPWIVAGDAGRVGVAWYGTPTRGEPNSISGGAQWRVRVALANDALSPSPTWSLANATGIVHQGPICTDGTGCIGNRQLLDFLTADATSAGALRVAYAQDYAKPATQPTLVATGVASQTSGMLLRVR